MATSPATTTTAQTSTEPHTLRRRRATSSRLATAGMEVFCLRGYDAATTGEVARVAGVAAGTFYVHFRDKRALYEHLAAASARELLERWQTAFTPTTDPPSRAVLALQIATEYWRCDLPRAGLLLNGGPAMGDESHARFVEEVARSLETGDVPLPGSQARSLALLVVGLGIEIGRLLVVRPEAQAEILDLIDAVRRAYQS